MTISCAVLFLLLLLIVDFGVAAGGRKKKSKAKEVSDADADADDDWSDDVNVPCSIGGQECDAVSEIFSPHLLDIDVYLKDRKQYTPVDETDAGSKDKSKGSKFETLGFITPWNNLGYNYSLTHRRFTYLSPVWFELTIKDGNVEISGRDNINEDWLDKVTGDEVEVSPSSTLPAPLPSHTTFIFPRIKVAFSETPLKPEEIAKAARLLINLREEFGFDGYVYESYQSKDMGLLLAKTLHEKKILLIFVMPAINPVDQSRKDQRTKYSNVLAYVERVIIMTYDYQNYEQKIKHSNSPKGWVSKIVSGYKEIYPKLVPKLLVGTPLYGWKEDKENSEVEKEAMTSSALDKWLKSDVKHSSVSWSGGNQEHHFEVADEVCVFPTPPFVLHRKETVKKMGVAGISYWELGQTNLATLSVC